MMLTVIVFWSPMLIILLMILEAINHQFILDYQLCGEV